MTDYLVQLEISGPVALWSRADTIPNPVSYVAPTLSAGQSVGRRRLRINTAASSNAQEDCP